MDMCCSGECACTDQMGSGCASSELRHWTRWGGARRATGTQLGGERRHIQAENRESKVAIGGCASDRGGSRGYGWLHHWSVSGGLGPVTWRPAPQCSPCLSSFLTKHRADERGVMSDGWAARSARLLCGATKKGPRQAPADRVERSTCSWRRSRATRDGATSGPALQARALGLRSGKSGPKVACSFQSVSKPNKTRPRRNYVGTPLRTVSGCSRPANIYGIWATRGWHQ
jgi:hypothetical protein